MKKNIKKIARIRRASSIRDKIRKSKKNRLIVYRTNKHIYAQIITSKGSKTITSASSLEKKINKKNKYTGNKKTAKIIGKILAIRALKNGIKKVAFDRSGFKYHGRVKSLANEARKFGLKF